jgi:hypothetical protein
MELSGVRFGRLKVLRLAKDTVRKSWVCVCDCGSTVVKAQADLRRGDTASCGCLRKELQILRNTTHGQTNTPAYTKWRSMWTRIYEKHKTKNRCYKNISICKRWEKFENFLADMGPPPEGYSLDRIDSSRGYCKSNCRWVPLVEQARNTTRVRLYKGVCISECARRVGLTPDVVFDRINKLGWNVERALNTPKREHRK